MSLSSQETINIKKSLREFAPYSILDRGETLFVQALVTECSKHKSIITGTVKEGDDTFYDLKVHEAGGTIVKASCECCSDEDMAEQWCEHAVALLLRAADMNYFTPEEKGTSPGDSLGINLTSSEQLSRHLLGANVLEEEKISTIPIMPEVKISVLREEVLGIQLYFDNKKQNPDLVTPAMDNLGRALDHLLVKALEEEAVWEESKEAWFIHSSEAADLILGLIQEYKDVLLVKPYSKQRLFFAKEQLSSRISIEWNKSGARITVNWLLPNSQLLQKDSTIYGNDPYWTIIENTLFKLSPVAARMMSAFPDSSVITYNRGQLAGLLEIINSGELSSSLYEISNPKLQPECQVKDPMPQLVLHEQTSNDIHFSSGQPFAVSADLNFLYPAAPAEENIVYLPNREEEQNCRNLLNEKGFTHDKGSNFYQIQGDTALDLVSSEKPSFPEKWSTEGLSDLKSNLKFTTLKINIEVSAAADQNDWFECNIKLKQNRATVPLSRLFKSADSKADKWVRLDNGSYAKVPGGGLKELSTILGTVSAQYKSEGEINAKLNTAQAIGLSRLKNQLIAVKSERKLKALADKLSNFDQIDQIKPTKNFIGDLRPYQNDGICWLNFLNSFGLDGILADEMGLGKTVQTLAFLQYLKDSRVKNKKLTKPVLITAPTSVITNWCYEASRFAPKLKILLLHGPHRKKHFSEITDYDIVITSYALLRIDRLELQKHKFSYVILDEAQYIKNHEASTTKAAKALDAEHRLALTGTPTENRPMELWSIMDFLMPGYLGSASFFRNNIEKAVMESGTGCRIAQFLKGKTKPFILRRLKSEVEKDLPPKTESIVHVPMTQSQLELYSQVLEEVRPKIIDTVQQKGVPGAAISILSALLRLRQICNHPNSIKSLKYAPGYESGKFDLLKELVTEALDSGHKILLFSQFKEMLSIIRKWFMKSEIPFLYLDGATKNRQDLIDQFNSDDNIRTFLISLKAGGTGLNLTAADTVIIYDPWWNPAVESQAIDRTHRIGQDKKVSVYRLVTENSVEQKIMSLKERKAQLTDALINENGLSSLNLSKMDIENLFAPPPEED